MHVRLTYTGLGVGVPGSGGWLYRQPVAHAHHRSEQLGLCLGLGVGLQG